MTNPDRGYDQVSCVEMLDHHGIEYRGPVSGRSGPQFNIKSCPRCGTSDWKVYLGEDTGLGNCFKCGPYNMWSFVKALLGTDDSKTIGKSFDEIAGLGGWKPKRREKRISAPALDGAVKLPNSIELPTPDGRTLPYLVERNISNDLARYFGLRYCHDGAFFYNDEAGEKRRTVFSGRILIPIWDLDRTLVTFQGRALPTLETDRKYLFPKRLPGTARFLYNGHNAVGASHIAMGEGAFDVIATKAALDQDHTMRSIIPVGSFGKNLTLTGEGPNQLTALLALRDAGLKIITIIWDGTPDALTAALNAAEQLTRYGFAMRIAFLPKGCDPNEVEPHVVRYAIANARSYSRSLAMKIKIRNPYK